MAISYRLPVVAQVQEQIAMRVSDIVWDSERQAMAVGNITVLLTSTEYRLLFPLRHGTPTTYAELATQAYNYEADDKVRVMMDKHIDRIRGKLRGTGFYIYCILYYGYVLLQDISPDNTAAHLSPKRSHRGSRISRGKATPQY